MLTVPYLVLERGINYEPGPPANRDFQNGHDLSSSKGMLESEHTRILEAQLLIGG